MEIDPVKLVENLRLQVSLNSPSLSMENFGVSRVKRSLRWTWLRLSTKRFHARNDAAAAVAAAGSTNRGEGLAVMLEPDVTFTVGGRQFRASRGVLATGSPVFEAELFGPMKETSTRHVKIDDMEPAVFEALLHFMATGALPDGCNEVAPLQHLLVAADRYGMHRLMAACEWKLCRSIDVETVATTLALAEQHHRVKLKDACIRFVSTKSVLCAVRETQGFSHLVESCPLVMADMLEHKLPSRVTQVLTLSGTHAKRSMNMLGTQARRGLGCLATEVGFIVGVVSSFGLVVFVLIKLDAAAVDARQDQDNSWRPSPVDQGIQELRSWIVRNQSTCNRIVSLRGSLQEWLPRPHLSS